MSISLAHTDFSDVEKHLLKENYILGLNVPSAGLVFFRIEAKEVINYVYDEIAELGPGSFVNYQRLGISSFNVSNAFEVKHEPIIYQIFYGIEPSAVRMYVGYPVDMPIGNLETRNVFASGPFGFKDGFQSPFPKPSFLTELFIPYNLQIGWALANPLNDNAKPLVNFVIGKYVVDVICDPDLIMRIMSGKKEARIATLGGATYNSSLRYDVKSTWGIDPIPMDATAEEITSITGAVKPVTYRGRGP